MHYTKQRGLLTLEEWSSYSFQMLSFLALSSLREVVSISCRALYLSSLLTVPYRKIARRQ